MINFKNILKILSFAFVSMLLLASSKPIFAGTNKALTWCSYVDVNNDSIGNFDRIPCIYTVGMGGSESANTLYCFHFTQWANGLKFETNCQKWLWTDLSLEDKKLIDNRFGKLANDFGEPVILKNIETEDMIIIHENEVSDEFQKCYQVDFQGLSGTIEPADLCWLNDESLK